MGLNSKIEWCHSSWNPWRGCHKISEGCLNCYMFREQVRYGGSPDKVIKSKSTFNQPLKWKAKGELAPGSRIFTCSWSDFFIEEADAWRKDAWEIIRNTPEYWYLILTKRSKRMLEEFDNLLSANNLPKNIVWMITTENQRTFDIHLPLLAEMKEECPSILTGLSVEPMLGRIDTREKLFEVVNWLIIGSESGSNKRSCKHDDVRFLRDQAIEIGIPVFIKQLDFNGKLIKMPVFDGKVWDEIPEKLLGIPN